MFDMFSGFSVSEILQYYATITIVASPVYLFAIIILYKKTTLIQKLNARIDRLIEKKYPKPETRKIS